MVLIAAGLMVLMSRVLVSLLNLLHTRKDVVQMEIIVSKRENGSRRVRILIDGDSKVEQSHAARVDINMILKRCRRTGLFPQRTGVPSYGDFTGAVDFQECLTRIDKANRDFDDLPSEIRSRFDNDPGKLLDFLADADNLAEAREIGLVPKPPEEPVPTPIVPSAESVDAGSVPEGADQLAAS